MYVYESVELYKRQALQFHKYLISLKAHWLFCS